MFGYWGWIGIVLSVGRYEFRKGFGIYWIGWVSGNYVGIYLFMESSLEKVG